MTIIDARLADAAHRRWWTLLTETWQLERHYEHDDRGCDHLLARRGDYLRWWTAHRAELTAALTTADRGRLSRWLYSRLIAAAGSTISRVSTM